jgi:hypothetical protein
MYKVDADGHGLIIQGTFGGGWNAMTAMTSVMNFNAAG